MVTFKSSLKCSSSFLIFFLILHQHPVQSKPLLNDLFNRFFGNGTPRPTTYHSSLTTNAEPVNYTYPRIWMTVSPVVDIDKEASKTDPKNTSVVRALELHWEAGPKGPAVGDFLELYYFDPTRMSGAQASPRPVRRYLLRDGQNKTMSKYIKTDVEFPYLNTSQIDKLVQTTEHSPYRTQYGLLSGRCLHYYVVYLDGSGNQAKALNCIQLSAHWMQEQFSFIADKTLDQIMLPGAHDATSFEAYRASDYETNVISRFQYTQDENLYAQLAYGIRYLDMRVGSYNVTDDDLYRSRPVSRSLSKNNSLSAGHPSTVTTTASSHTTDAIFHEELWMVHGIQRNHIRLRDALKQVRRFLERTTHEVVIVDFHRFVAGFDEVDDLYALQTRLRHFYKIVVEELGPFLIPYSANRLSSIGKLVREGKRVYLGYAYKFDHRGLFDSDLFWPAVDQLWANSDELATLESYLNGRICQTGNNNHRTAIHLRSAMAELTPTIQGIIFQKYHGLRELAQLVNLHYDNWFRRLWWKCSNIVAADFFLGSDIVQIAIDVNRRRFANATTTVTYETSILLP